jgi:hypothetical protein
MVETCKSCGFPANRYWPPKQRPIIVYCGREDCLNKLVKIHKKPAIVRAAERAEREDDQALKDKLDRELGYCC